MDAGRRILLCFSFRGKFIFKHDGNLLVKRIAAVEGETIERNEAILTVPEGCYYVLGDNVEHSYDSSCLKFLISSIEILNKHIDTV